METRTLLIIGAAGLGAWWLLSSSSAPAAAASAPPAGGAAPPPTPAPPAPTPVLDQTYAALVASMQKAAPGDPAITLANGAITASADVFNYYLAHLPNTPVSTPPAPGSVFGGQVPPQMTSLQYWGGMAPYLKSTLGLSGVGLAGLAAFALAMERNR